MTTGEPLSCAGAMKPLPTLTKPLRSVDTETKEPARRCASAPTRARSPPPASWARRWSRWCSRAAYREKFGGDHIDDVLGAALALRGTDRLESAEPALVFVGFMGPGSPPAARTLAAELGGRGARLGARGRARLGEPVEA